MFSLNNKWKPRQTTFWFWFLMSFYLRVFEIKLFRYFYDYFFIIWIKKPYLDCCKYYYCKNYNLKTGKEIKLSDVFSGNYLPVLTKIAEKKFRKFYDVSQNESLENAGFWFDKGIFRLNDNYSFNTFAVTFQFNSYEVAAYAMGAPEIIIPYSEIKSIIRPDGLLGKFIK